MAKSDPTRKTRTRVKRLPPSERSARIIREWRGCDEPVDFERGLSRPSDFIHSILEAAGAADGLHEDQLKASWNELAGEFIASQTDPVSVKQGELLLRVSQPALRFQLERMKPQLIARMRAALGHDVIQSIRFTHG
jgi:hypothetical protein